MSVRGKGRKAREVSACSIRCQKNLEKGTGQCHNKERAVPVCLSVLTLLVDVGTLGQEELQHALAVWDAGRDHQRRPSAAVLNVWVEFWLVSEELDDVQVVRRCSPVDGIAAVVILAVGQFWVVLGGVCQYWV